MDHSLIGVQNQVQIYLSSAQQPSYHYGLNKIQNDEVNKKNLCLDRCRIRKVQRDVFTFLEKPFSRILSGKVPSIQYTIQCTKIFEYIYFQSFNVYLIQAAGVYHLASFLAVVLCLVVTIFSTIKGYEEISFTVLFYLESVILVQYSLEYILRLWSCGTHGRFKGLKGMALIPGPRTSVNASW